MGRKDREVVVVTEGTLRTGGRGRTCRSCGGTTGWHVKQQDGRTVVVHACGTTQ